MDGPARCATLLAVEDWGGIRELAARQDGVVTLGQARAAGLDDRGVTRLVRAGRWERIARGAYLIDAEPATRLAILRAAVVSFGPAATAVLDTAAELHGIAGLRTTDAVHVSLPGPRARPARPRAPRVMVHQLDVRPEQVATVHGIPVTNPLRTVADIILRARRYPAVAVLDSALNRGLIDDNDLAALPAALHGRRGAVAARKYLAQADGRAESPLETRVRLRCVDGKVPPEVLQLPIWDDDGYLLAVGDLGWPSRRFIVEADGRGPHANPHALYGDRRRQNRIVSEGWRLLRFTWNDARFPELIPAAVRTALAGRGRTSR